MRQKSFTKEQLKKLIDNGRTGADHVPVVKFFTPWGSATWLISELCEEDNDIAYGLCDLGIGYPELGEVSISEIVSIAGPFGLTVERDMNFTGEYPISVYAEAARIRCGITEDRTLLSAIQREAA